MLERLQNIYWMKNWTTATNVTVEEVITLSNNSIERYAWNEQLSAHFNTTSEGFRGYSFTIYNTEFFSAFFQVLLSDGEATLAYFMGWCIVQVVSQLATKDLIQHSYTSDYEATTGHEELCATITLSYMGLPFYAGYVRRYVQPLTVSRAYSIFENTRAAFSAALEISKLKTLLPQLNALSIGGETSILELVREHNADALDSMYKQFPNMKESVWHNIPAATNARRAMEVNESLLDYLDDDLQPVYRQRKQYFELLPIAFETPFYDDDVIPAASYGALGSEMASGLAAHIFKLIILSGNDTSAMLDSKASCLTSSQTNSTAGSHALWDKKKFELLVRSTALRMTHHAYFTGDRIWRDYRLSGYTHLTDRQLLFIFSCLLQCGKPDAKFNCNGPVEAFRSFGTTFSCAPGDPMYSGRDCDVLI
ncbi:hypothetical protein HPB48_013047 [Haemaphysalis longicornis]|uniref:Uncharacterized protein n=1 Tax=Haemaphysalis longicornis TaxID=44386 RepID=A0A9J6GS22_HAELO|nr:hypothetical protein HPB48_013047 [Haemaphysalis longicornis]